MARRSHKKGAAAVLSPRAAELFGLTVLADDVQNVAENRTRFVVVVRPGERLAEVIDRTRAVLGVPGMNYSTLLTRSIDYDPFSAINSVAYPDPFDQTFGQVLIQMLWDRGEGNGYAAHTTTDRKHPGAGCLDAGGAGLRAPQP